MGTGICTLPCRNLIKNGDIFIDKPPESPRTLNFKLRNN